MVAKYDVIVAYSVPVGVQDITNGKGSSRGTRRNDRKEKVGSGHSPTARPKLTLQIASGTSTSAEAHFTNLPLSAQVHSASTTMPKSYIYHQQAYHYDAYLAGIKRVDESKKTSYSPSEPKEVSEYKEKEKEITGNNMWDKRGQGLGSIGPSSALDHESEHNHAQVRLTMQPWRMSPSPPYFSEPEVFCYQASRALLTTTLSSVGYHPQKATPIRLRPSHPTTTTTTTTMTCPLKDHRV